MSRPPAYEISRVVTFQETNSTGNVYFTEYLKWQGECRELFLTEYAPDVIEELSRNVRLFTSQCQCEYLGELFPFDRVTIRMREGESRSNSIELIFDYLRSSQLIARGSQHLAWFEETDAGLAPTRVPEALLKGIRQARQDFLAAQLVSGEGAHDV